MNITLFVVIYIVFISFCYSREEDFGYVDVYLINIAIFR